MWTTRALWAGGWARRSFTGEDPFLLPSRSFNDPDDWAFLLRTWHHLRMTFQASMACGFRNAGARSLAWHADSLDSYAYNPLFWVNRFPDVLKAALASSEELERLHFDDLFETGDVTRAWQRLWSGTVAGLVWAHEHDPKGPDVAAARQVLGASCHAVQDFYSHSNWIDDPERRAVTYFEATPAQRYDTALWTGSYEAGHQHGVKPHGEVHPACAVLKLEALQPVLEVICHAASPLSGGTLCGWWKECKDARSTDLKRLGEIKVPDGVAYLAPPGIALDAHWLAETAVKERGLVGITGEQAMNRALALAEGATVQWLTALGRLVEPLMPGFWNVIRQAPRSVSAETAQWEDFGRFPHRILAAGRGRKAPDRAERPEWYVRLQIRTDGASGSGTNANVYALADGERFLLDNLASGDDPDGGGVLARLLEHDDFEPGDVQNFVIGPFKWCPPTVTLRNDAADIGDVIRAAFRSLGRKIEALVDGIGDALLSLISGHPDLVGKAKKIWYPDELSALPLGEYREFSRRVHGGSEGVYDIHGSVQLRGTRSDAHGEWRRYQVSLNRLECIKESEWDRGSDSDEPFLIGLLVPFGGGEPEPYLSQVYEDVDSKEVKHLRHTFQDVEIPASRGMLSLTLTLHESDDESGRDRRALLREFATRHDGQVEVARRGFLDTLGAAIGPDWKVANVNAFAFCIGDVVRAGHVLDAKLDRWIEGDRSLMLSLDRRRLGAHVTIRKPAAPLACLYTWWREDRLDHKSTTAAQDATAFGDVLDNYHCFRRECLIFRPQPAQRTGVIPLVNWYSAEREDHHATTEPRMSGTIGTVRGGYRLFRVEGYVYDPARRQPHGTVALSHWWNPDRKDNRLTTEWTGKPGDERDGYRCVRVAGYAYPVVPGRYRDAFGAG